MIKEFEELTEQMNDLYNGGGFRCICGTNSLGQGYVQIRSALLHGGTQLLILPSSIKFDGLIDFKMVKVLNDFIANHDVAKLFQNNSELLEAQND